MRIEKEGFKMNKTFAYVSLYVVGSALITYGEYLDSGLPAAYSVAGTLTLILAGIFAMAEI